VISDPGLLLPRELDERLGCSVKLRLPALIVCGLALMLSASVWAALAEPRALPARSLRLLVVRHGTAEQDSLTSRGVAEARAAANLLKQQEIVAVVASPAMRTQQTASIIAQELGLPVLVAKDGAFMVKQGESVEQATTRALVTTRILAQRYTGKTIVIVTHFDICAALRRHAAANPKAAPCPRHTWVAPSITEIAVLPDGELRLVGPSSF